MKALGIETEADIKRLVEYFITVSKPDTRLSQAQGGKLASMKPSREQSQLTATEGQPSPVGVGAERVQVEGEQAGEVIAESRHELALSVRSEQPTHAATSVREQSARDLMRMEGIDLVHPNEAVRVLLQFVEDNQHLVEQYVL